MTKDTHLIFVNEWQLESPPARERPQQVDLVELPPPEIRHGLPLMQALRDRQSSREFSPEALSQQMLSNLLWAAFGVNRPESGGRTAPSAENWHEIDLYVATAAGLFVYDAQRHVLRHMLRRDIRSETGLQAFAGTAPLDLVYVADFARTRGAAEEERRVYSVANTGFIAQNVYLFCASEGLSTTVRGAIDRPALARTMNLTSDQSIILAQTVGYPARTH